MIKKITTLLTMATALLLVACAKQDTPSPAASSQESSQVSSSMEKGTSSSSPASSSSQVAEGTISGTYKGTDETDQVTLVIQGDKGTWTASRSRVGDESKPVQIDEVNQSMVIGDDTYRYRVDGQQLTLEDLDQEIDDHGTIVLTKQ